MTRHCARPACAERASATLGYDYGQGVVWLADLSAMPHPMNYDLCGRHATSLGVPRGWELRDLRRSTRTLVAEAS
jgi:hypothetical protein